MSHKHIHPMDLMTIKTTNTCILDVRTTAEVKASKPIMSLARQVRIMNNLNLPNPQLMDIVIPANRVCRKD